jgi:hypothetical protein
MLVLVKEVVGAIKVAQIVELPRLGCCEPAANHILIDEDFNGTKVASKIARIGIGSRFDALALAGCPVTNRDPDKLSTLLCSEIFHRYPGSTIT